METAIEYLNQYRQATNADERTAIVAAYSAFFDTIPPNQQVTLRAYMQHELKPSIDETVQTLDMLMEKAEMILSQPQKADLTV